MKEIILIHVIAKDFKCGRYQSGLCPTQPLRADFTTPRCAKVSYVGRRTAGGAAQRALHLGLHTPVFFS
jgi:hypothetical protein